MYALDRNFTDDNAYLVDITHNFENRVKIRKFNNNVYCELELLGVKDGILEYTYKRNHKIEVIEKYNIKEDKIIF